MLVELGLLSKPQTSNCRPATGETIGKAKACWAGGAVQIYLNLEGRDPAGGGLQQVAAADEASTVAAIKAAFLGVADPNDWTGDGAPEGWKVMDRAYTKAEARYIPNGPDSTTNMAHPDPDRRRGGVRVPAVPVRRGHAGHAGRAFGVLRPARLRARRAEPPRQREHAGHLPGRRTGDREEASAQRPDHRHRADHRVPAPGAAAAAGAGTGALDLLRKGCSARPLTILGINDFHGQLDPTTTPIDGINTPVGGAANLATLFDEDAAALPEPALMLAGGDNVGASPPNSSLLEDKPAIDVENAWGLDATSYGNHEFDYGVDRLQAQQERADFPFLATNIVETATGKAPSWVRHVAGLHGQRGQGRRDRRRAWRTPRSWCPRGATEGLTFLPAAPRIKAESKRLRSRGRQGADRGDP